jgi:hypothetical protein
MPDSDQGESPTPDDLRRGSTASNADDVFESPPSTPTPDTPRDLDAEREKEQNKGTGSTGEKTKGELALPIPPPTQNPTASSSSLNLPLSDPNPTLDLPSATPDQLLASLRSQVTDLASQVTGLNLKLVKSYTTRGELEDDLHDKEELSQRLLRRVAELEKDKQKWEREIEAGGWVEKVRFSGSLASYSFLTSSHPTPADPCSR